MNQSFNLKRISWLSKKELYESFFPHFKILTIVVSAIVLVRCIVEYFEKSSLHINSNGAYHHNNFSYEGMFIIFGFVYTINSFKALRHLPTRSDFLTLPATPLEKVFTKWFFGNVLYWIGIFIVFTFFYFFQKMIIGGFMGKPFDTFDILSRSNFTGLHYIIVVFSVYFFGAATFNTGGWYKVITWGVVLSLLYIILLFLFAYALFPEMRSLLGGHMEFNSGNSASVDLMLEDFWVIKFAKFFILYLAAPFFWFMTYLKIKEKEV
jgi:hypothetical protein